MRRKDNELLMDAEQREDYRSFCWLYWSGLISTVVMACWCGFGAVYLYLQWRGLLP